VVGLADEFGTPLYVVDHGRLRKNYTGFLGAFRRGYPEVEVDYSYKTNPLPGVLRALHRLGAGAEVISPFELWLALELGVPPDRITFNGPAKTEQGLALAVSRGIRLINIDNLSEIDAIQRLASDAGSVQQVGVRVTTSVGWSSQFGLSLRNGAALEAFDRISRSGNLKPCGLHLHLGTGIKSTTVYRQAVREVLEFADLLRARAGVEIRFFDLGGGFGIPTVRSYSFTDQRLMLNGFPPRVMDLENSPPLDSYGESIVGLFRQYRPPTGHADPVIIFEPGRAVTSSAQSLVLRVLAIKPAPRGGYHAILDGGLNVAMPTSFEYHEALPASKMKETPSAFYNLCGPLCHPSDVLCFQKQLPRLEPGDVVAVMDAGAYFIPNQMNFSNPRSAAVMVEGGQAELIRSRESFEDVVRFDGRRDGSGERGAGGPMAGTSS
jgi:diaminopimelate decarboxylase